MPVLYRKYRPQTFASLTGQDSVKRILLNQVAKGKIGHAYLFTGPRGVGKTSSARILAKAINCTTRAGDDGEPCNECEACIEVVGGRSLDVIEIDAASHTGVDTVRETIIDTVRFAPSRLKYKVFIIDEVHMLSTAAWNALLKILEEPPAHVVFILATTESHKIPATILSRCQRFDFKRIKTAVLIERLKMIIAKEKVKVLPDILASIARLAEGGLRDAESLLEQLLTVGGNNITEKEATLVLPTPSMPRVFAFLRLLFASHAKEAVALVNEYFEDGIDLYHLTNGTIEVLRKGLVINIGGEIDESEFDRESMDELRKLSKDVPTSKLLYMLEVLLRRSLELKGSVIPQLPLELAIVEICLVDGTPHGAIETRNNDEKLQQVETPVVKENFGKVQDQKKESDPEPVAEQAMASIPGTDGHLGMIRNVWKEILAKVAETNPSLPLVLQNAEPINVAKGILMIGVPFPFHRDKINEEKNRKFLSDIISAHCNVSVRIEGVVSAKKTESGLVGEILQAFGGSLVE